MNWLAHSFIALFCALLAIFLYTYIQEPTINFEYVKNAIIFFAIVGVSAIAPDIDIAESKFFRWTEIVIFIALVGLSYLLFGLTITALEAAIGSFIVIRILMALFIPRHRGFVHSLIFMGIIAGIIWLAFNNIVYVAGFAFGFYLHLVADGLILKVW